MGKLCPLEPKSKVHSASQSLPGKLQRNNNGKAGDLVFIVSLTLALSGASISQKIKLPKLDCALTRHSEKSLGSRRGTMGFCWSGECGNRPCWADHYMPCYAGWVGPTVLLCIYGFCSMMRPIEPFMTEFLTGTYKNLTSEQVTRQVIPVWTYSSLVLLAPILLVTDFLRYKPVIILQGLTYVTAFLLLLVGSGVHSAQLAFFCYSTATAADVAYFSYIYSMVLPSYYQRVTSYVRGAILLGYAVGALLAQLLVSLGGVSLYCLAFVTLISVSVSLITSFFLPMPESRLFLNRTYSAQQGNSAEDNHDSESLDISVWVKGMMAAKQVGRMFRRLIWDCKKCYSSAAVLFFCIWAAAGRCGFTQVTSYVQLLWVYMQPHNFTAYNGGVDAISTLSGAAATVAVGHVSLEWSVWGELVLGVFTFLIAGSVFLMDMSDNIWISYACFFLFKTVYMQLTTICTFQIAKMLNRSRFALVFGMNSFVGTVLQSVLTAIVINTKSLQLTITSQFLIYASYFAAISVLFTVRGVYTLLHMKLPTGGHQPERANALPEASHL
ncbi:thiamine transporter 2-like [Micropterus salmoides]|uniref:thiamine transporter 2-like n=1 Tax=Micropterus salmoides TaxID=27706 RepID=UPI0018EA82B1|nr:thiamine transporter 2-like [Micropterus salmoides]